MRFTVACLLVAPTIAQTEFLGIEPNDHKFQATPAFGITDGDHLRALSGFGYGTVDHNVFRLQHAPAPVALYRHDLVGSGSLSPEVLGRDAVTDFVYPQSNATVQQGLVTTGQQQFLRWYGFGRSEELYVDLAMFGSMRSYSSVFELRTTPVVPHDLGAFPLTLMRVRATLPGAPHQDTAMMLFDGEFNAVPGMWIDDPLGSPVAELLFDPHPGVYYLAVSDESAVTHLPPTPNDSVVTLAVLDHAGAAIGRSAIAPIDVNVKVWSGPNLLSDLTVTKNDPYELIWIRIQLGNGQSIFSFCAGDGTGGPCPSGPSAAPLSSQGCVNSTGRGATARVHALYSAAAPWHLRLEDLPPLAMALPFLADTTSAHSPIHAGLVCVGPGARRLPVLQADLAGTIDVRNVVPSSVGFLPGTTLYLQAAYRDVLASPGSQVNLTGGYGFLLR